MPDDAIRARLQLDTPVKYVKGVGPQLAAQLEQRGIVTVEDLVYTLPFRYEDRSRLRPIRELMEGESATVVAQIGALAWVRTRRGMIVLRMMVGDGTGHLECLWYHGEFLRDRFQSGQTVALFGRVERDGARHVLRQPEFEILGPGEAEGIDSLKLGRIVPVYEAMGTLTSGRMRVLVHRALAGLPPRLVDPLPARLRERRQLPGRREALLSVHFPPPEADLATLQAARSAGHIRLIFDELFYLQAGLELKRRRIQRQPGHVIGVHAGIRERLKAMLPFHPTADQKQVLREIVTDFGSGHPMRRLLQGDVGSGKTIVALEAAVIAMENGCQVALMAPTQILAAQHFRYARERLPNYDIRLVTGGLGRQARGRGGAGPQMAIGTHALLSEGASGDRLGLVIVDEQHKFGVMQRLELMRKNDRAAPHLLVMTATPIPRTLALALYGDLDTSTIRQPPPGRPPIITRLVSTERMEELYAFVERQLAAGRQAYFVYPVIDESETLDVKPARRMYEQLCRRLPTRTVGLLHGRLPEAEKNQIMDAFRDRRLQVLAATTVIEVGVDVPNATVLVVEDAERFGIAQLHQLRGRVGRPQPDGRQVKSYCFLVHGDCTENGKRRLEALAATRDGFELAELDLRMRGPGEFFGTRQSGLPLLQVADPLRDHDLMEQARMEARAYLDAADPMEQRALVRQIQQRWQRRYGLIEVG